MTERNPRFRNDPAVSQQLIEKAGLVKMLLTDCDGVLTDNGVYYSPAGELLKRFSIRDGMGVERLRTLAGVETGIISGEHSAPLKRRAEKLGIEECHLGISNKAQVVRSIIAKRGLSRAELAYIGDDVNDLEVFALVGLCACPSDAFDEVRGRADMICRNKGDTALFASSRNHHPVPNRKPMRFSRWEQKNHIGTTILFSREAGKT